MNITATKSEVEITARAKAFSGEPIKTHKFLVRGAEVSVWDRVAGHYTTCHSLTARAEARIRRLAA